MIPTGSEMNNIPAGDRRPFFRYSVALLVVALAFGARLLIDAKLGIPLSPFILFYPAVMVAAWYGGLGPGILSLGLSLLLGQFFFVEPRYTFFDVNVPDFFHMMLFIFVSLTICFLTENLRRVVQKQNVVYRELFGSQQKVSSILESVQGCFFSLDEENNFIHINEDCKAFIDEPREHYIGKNVWEAFGYWRESDFEKHLLLARERREPREFEFFDERKTKWYGAHLSPTKEGISVHIYDISSRKEAESALMESEERFRLVSDQAPVMVWTAGQDALFQYVNEPWLKFRGRTLEQECGNGWTEGIHADDLSAFMDVYLQAVHAREPFRAEYRLQRFDGRYRWILNTGVPRFGPKKNFMGFIGSAIDITARKEFEDRQNLEHRITQALSDEDALARNFEKILGIICEGLGWDVGAYWEIDPFADLLRCRKIISVGGPQTLPFLEGSPEHTFARGVGLTGRVWSLGKAFWIQDLQLDSNFPRRELAKASGLSGGACFPIRLGPEILGVMEFFHSEIQEPDPSLLQVFESIGIEIGQAIERYRTKEALKVAYEDMEKRVQERTSELGRINEILKEEIRERLKVEREVLEISMKEQRRLGALIHDDLCQSLAGIVMMAKVLKQKLDRRGLPESQDLQQITALLDETTLQARDMARGFYPVELKADSLMIALNDLAKRTSKVYGISCVFNCPEPVLIDDNNVATHIYRIVQEASLNAAKHGKADSVEIRLAHRDGRLEMTVQDNGIGLSPETRSPMGIGMHIMKYRARMIDAKLEIRNLAPKGTLLICSFSPLGFGSGEQEGQSA